MRRYALAGLAVFALLAPASAEEATTSELRDRLTAAHTLAETGRRDRDARALVEAARTIGEFPGRVAAPGQSGRDAAAYDVDALLEEAARLAPGDAAVVAQMEQLQDRAGPSANDEWWEQVCDADGNCKWVRWVCSESNLCRQVEE